MKNHSRSNLCTCMALYILTLTFSHNYSQRMSYVLKPFNDITVLFIYYLCSATSSLLLWVFWWVFRMLSWAKHFPQVLQVYPEWWTLAMCALSCSSRAYLWSHSVHAWVLWGRPWIFFLWARRASTEGNKNSQPVSEHGILSSIFCSLWGHPSVAVESLYASQSSVSSSLIFFLATTSKWASLLGLWPRFLPSSEASWLTVQAEFSWCFTSSSSVW